MREEWELYLSSNFSFRLHISQKWLNVKYVYFGKERLYFGCAKTLQTILGANHQKYTKYTATIMQDFTFNEERKSLGMCV